MNRTELLAPAGSYEALVAAVQNGCDALYLAGTSFGARAYANNFEEEELRQGIAYAHTYGVRVFVTVNTLIKESEIPACLIYVKSLQEMDVDALIIQDMGLFTLLRKHVPDLELHASTQMHIHNPQGIQLLKELGAARVVLPRETGIEEIRRYHKLGVDLEVFIQGALCVSYSGQCLMSAMSLNRSGNRGECAQNCRMKYTLEKTDVTGTHLLNEETYLLSCKDLNTLAYIPQLIEAGIFSFKIEGRMKRPEYVALMVSLYRKAIDAYEQHLPFSVDKAMREEMEKIFNRGFTYGHLFHKTGSALMNYHRPNHMGIVIGRVSGFTKDQVSIRLEKDVVQGDGIRILTSRGDEGFTINRMYQDGLLVNHGKAGDTIALDKTFYADKNSIVVKSSDVHQLKQLQESYDKIRRKVAVYGAFYMAVDSMASLEVYDEEGFQVRVESMMPASKARTTPLDEARIAMQLQKSGDTPFSFVQISYDLDGDSILPLKELNQMRRSALSKLAQKRTIRHPKRRLEELCYEPSNPLPPLDPLIVVVHTMEQYTACKDAGITSIYVEGSALYERLRTETGVYERTPRLMKQAYPNHHVMVQEAGGVQGHQPVITDTSLHVCNAYTAKFLFEQGAQGVCFSLENSLQECIEIAQSYEKQFQQKGNFLYPIYGREELMLSEYCVINAVEKDNGKKDCGLCRKNSYALLDMKKQRYPILCDEACRMHILNAQPRMCCRNIARAQKHHITSFLCVFTIENAKECEEVLTVLKEEVIS